jgi:hypothetical protein
VSALLERVLGVEVRAASLRPVDHATNGPVHVQPSADGTADVAIFRTAEGYRMACFGCIDVDVDATGRSITVDARSPATDLDVADLLTSIVFPLVSQLQGRPAIHGSCIAVEGHAVAFAGATGAGKSTLAALLGDRGGRLVADDTLLVRIENDDVVIDPTSSTIRLREAEKLGIQPGRGERRANGKLAVSYPHVEQPMRLEHLYVLGTSRDAVTVERARPRDAAIELAQYLFRIDPRDPALLRAELPFLSALAERLPVSRLCYPRELGAADGVLDVIRRSLAT